MDLMDLDWPIALNLEDEVASQRWSDIFGGRRVTPKKKAKTMPTPYSKLKSDKKAEALGLLHTAAKKGFGEQFSKLANEYGVPLAEKGKEGRSAMHLIAEKGHVQLMKDFLKKHLPQLDGVLQDGVNFRERLQRAEQYRSEATLTLGKYVKNKSKHGWKPLHFAVKACTTSRAGERGVEMVALLLLVQGDSSMLATQRRVRTKKSGEETTRSKSGGESPVHIAAKCGAVRALELIWEWCVVFGREGENNEKFAPFTEPDEKGWTPLHHAVATNRSEVVEWLLDRERRDLTRLNIDALSEKGYTALMTAAEYSHNEMCMLLLRNKAKVDCAAADGLTALHLAAMHDNKELVELLLEHEAFCKAQDEQGNTPLHIARKKYCLEAATALADRDRTVLQVPNKEGHTPENIPPEDKEFIPQEIRKRGRPAIRVYEEALKDGKTQIPHVKFVLLGEAGHGKTSLLRLLEGEKFEPDSTSTEGIDCDLVSSKTLVGTDEASWKKHDRLNSTDALAGYLKKNLPEPATAATAKQKNPLDGLTEGEVERQIAKLFHPPPPSVVPRGGHRPAAMPVLPLPHGFPVLVSHSTWGTPELHSPSSHQPPSRLERWPPPPHPHPDREPTRRPPPPQQHERPAREGEAASLRRRTTEPHRESIAKLPEGPPNPPVPARMLSDPGTGRAIDRALSKMRSGGSKAENPKLTFTTYDFAGQDLYRPMHHCFITQRSVFVIVYNSQEYNRLRKEGDEERYKYISYWFNTVSAYTEVMGDPKLGKKPPVFLVGTHRGPYNDGRGKKFLQLAPGDEKMIREDLSDCYQVGDEHDRYLGHLKGSDQEHFYFVESSQESKESGAPGLRCCLRKKAESLPFMKEEYPVRWLQLEEKLKDRGLVLLAKVKEEAKVVGFPFPPSGGECKEFEQAMKFLHDIGVITYPCELPRVFLSDEEIEELKEVVLCGPQQLPNMMKEVVLFKEYHLDDLPHDDYKILTQRPVATKNALRVFLKKFLDPKSEDESLHYLCLLLRAYGLIVKAEDGDSDPPPPEEQQTPPQYLIPCKLQHLYPIPKPERESFSFVADFQGYLPQEVFTRFVCWAALKARESVLRPRPKTKRRSKGESKCCLMQNFCSVKHFMIRGDAWSITFDEANSRMVFDVSLPHECGRKLVEFLLFAFDQLHQLCKDLKLSGLLYQVGKEFTCRECSEEDFFVVASQEQGSSPQDLKEFKGECDSCSFPVSIEELLSQDLEQPNDKLKATPTEEQLRRHICNEVGEKWQEVCTFLGIPNKRIIDKKQDYHTNKEAFFQCLMDWADENTGKEPTWRVLLDALEEAGLTGMATSLKKRLLDDKL